MSRVTDVMIGVWLAIIPLVVYAVVVFSNGGTYVQVNHSFQNDYNACKADIADLREEMKSVEDNRDVYCVKEFGKPSSFAYFLPTVWFIVGLGMYLFALFGDKKRGAALDEREKRLDEREAQLNKRKKR